MWGDTQTQVVFQVVSIWHVKAKPSCFLINMCLDTATLGRNVASGKVVLLLSDIDIREES